MSVRPLAYLAILPGFASAPAAPGMLCTRGGCSLPEQGPIGRCRAVAQRRRLVWLSMSDWQADWMDMGSGTSISPL